jgi:hypothetical protein
VHHTVVATLKRAEARATCASGNDPGLAGRDQQPAAAWLARTSPRLRVVEVGNDLYVGGIRRCGHGANDSGADVLHDLRVERDILRERRRLGERVRAVSCFLIALSANPYESPTDSIPPYEP